GVPMSQFSSRGWKPNGHWGRYQSQTAAGDKNDARPGLSATRGGMPARRATDQQPERQDDPARYGAEVALARRAGRNQRRIAGRYRQARRLGAAGRFVRARFSARRDAKSGLPAPHPQLSSPLARGRHSSLLTRRIPGHVLAASAAFTRAGVIGYCRSRTPVASKNALAMAAAGAPLTSPPPPVEGSSRPRTPTRLPSPCSAQR